MRNFKRIISGCTTLILCLNFGLLWSSTYAEDLISETIIEESGIEAIEESADEATDETDLEVSESKSELAVEETTEPITEEEALSTEPTEVKEETEITGMLSLEYQYKSMLPLEEKKAYLVVGNHDDVDISAVPVNLVLDNLLDSSGNHIEIDESARVVWSYYKDTDNNVISDDYFVIEDGGTLDLSLFEEYDQYTLEMIVGDGNQLNPENIRYIVTVYLSDTVTELRTYELYIQNSDGTRYKVESNDVCVQGSPVEVAGVSYSSSIRQFLVPEHVNGTEYYLGVNSPMDEHPFIRLDVITFDEYYKYVQAQAQGQEYSYATINEQILNQNMNATDSGYKTTLDSKDSNNISSVLSNALYFIYKDEATGEILTMDCVKFIIDSRFSYFTNEAYDYVNGQQQNVMLNSVVKAKPIDFEMVGTTVINAKELYINSIWLKKGYSPDEEYYYRLDAHSKIWDNANEHVIKAVEGYYDTLKDAAEADDIKEQLLPTNSSTEPCGYKSDYSIDNGGVYFSVFFDDNSSFKFWVVFNEYDPKQDTDYIREYSNVPVIGEADPWFRITGAKNSSGNELDTYVIENGKSINVDTMYGYGYQAVFINENVNSFEPTFWLANSELILVETIYVNGRHFNVGDTISFPDGENTINAMFSVIINDGNGKHTKNYNVSFIKKAKGAKLYVAGPVSPDVRSVFLDEYFEYKHDIFIANIGDTALTDLRLELDAKNVTLDPYWKIGGIGNNTLAPCTDNFQLELLSTNYGELSNVAKIRLIPDGKNSGEIDGTLKIYSGSKLLETIKLSGRAQNPEIITSEIDDAVLYVPYSYLVTTNNMYDWTNVNFSISGELPEGVKFYSETGEIYGVPLETGEFEFKVTAEFISETYSFDSSTVTLKLKVKDNTNLNVYTASDEDYDLLDAIGTDVGEYDFVLDEYGDELFRSKGVLEQFVGLWLNGKLLVEGVDYDAESGSTKITVYAQTFKNKATQSGVNTIAAEFRTSDTDSLNNSGNTNELKRTAQNFRLDINPDNKDDDNSHNSNSNSNQSSNGDGIQQNTVTNSVTCTVRIVDSSGDPMSYLLLELHSAPQSAATNSMGIASFKPIEFGSHALYIKKSDGSISAQKNFKVISGNNFSVNGDTITAVDGSSFTLDVEYSENQLKFLSGNISNMSGESKIVGQSSSNLPSPKTGDDFKPLIIIFMLIVSLVAIVVLQPKKL